MKVALGVIAYLTNEELEEEFKKFTHHIKQQLAEDVELMCVINSVQSDSMREFIKSKYPYVMVNTKNNVATAWNLMIIAARQLGCNRLIISNADVTYKHNAIANWTEWSKTNLDYVTGALLHQDQQCKHPYIKKEVWYCSFMLNMERFEEFANSDVDTNWQGFFDSETHDPAYYEDIDYHYRVLRSGFTEKVCGAAQAYHLGSISRKLDHSVDKQVKAYYDKVVSNHIKKWGGSLGQRIFDKPYSGNYVPFN